MPSGSSFWHLSMIVCVCVCGCDCHLCHIAVHIISSIYRGCTCSSTSFFFFLFQGTLLLIANSMVEGHLPNPLILGAFICE